MKLNYPAWDIRNIFDIAIAASDEQARKQKRQEELQVLRNFARHECGSCDKWMKSRECPRERNVKGMSRGPSCKDYICSAFVGNSRYHDAVAKLAAVAK